MCRAPGPGFEAVAPGGAKEGAQRSLAPGLVLFVRAFIFETGCTFGPITWNMCTMR